MTLWTIAWQAPLSLEFSRQECWSRLPFPSLGDLPDPGTEPGSPALQTDSLVSEPPGIPKVIVYLNYIYIREIWDLGGKEEVLAQYFKILIVANKGGNVYVCACVRVCVCVCVFVCLVHFLDQFNIYFYWHRVLSENSLLIILFFQNNSCVCVSEDSMSWLLAGNVYLWKDENRRS